MRPPIDHQRRHHFIDRLVPLAFVAITVAVTICAAMQHTKAADKADREDSKELSIVRTLPQYSRPLRIVSQRASDDGKSASVTFDSTGGIFRVEIDLANTHFERLTFIVKDVRSWEGVEFFPKVKDIADGEDVPLDRQETIDLQSTKDVTVRAQGQDCVIEFGPAAINILRRGGKFQFIDAYRV